MYNQIKKTRGVMTADPNSANYKKSTRGFNNVIMQLQKISFYLLITILIITIVDYYFWLMRRFATIHICLETSGMLITIWFVAVASLSLWIECSSSWRQQSTE